MSERAAFGGPVLLQSAEKISSGHLARDAYVYVRQSTPSQVLAHTESLARQYELRERAQALGWPAHQVVVIDADLGRSGAEASARTGFRELVADVGLGKVGIVLGIEVSRLARNISAAGPVRADRHVDRRTGCITRRSSMTGSCSGSRAR